MTWKNNNFECGPEQQQAFEQIKWEIVCAVPLGPVRTGRGVKICFTLQPGTTAQPGASGRKHLERLEVLLGGFAARDIQDL